MAPGEFLVEEIMFPFRGQLIFHQYIPTKRHMVQNFSKYAAQQVTFPDYHLYTGQIISDNEELAEIDLELGEPYFN